MASRTEFPIVARPGHQWHPSIDGDKVYWYEGLPGDLDVLGATISVSSAPGQFGTADISISEFVAAGGPGDQWLPGAGGGKVVYLSDATVARLVPEPASVVLLLLGLASVSCFARRIRR